MATKSKRAGALPVATVPQRVRQLLNEHVPKRDRKSGKVVRDVRGRVEMRPVTQKEIAARLGVNDRTIRKWLSGERKTPAAPLDKKINREVARVRRSLEQYTERDVKKTGGSVPPRSRGRDALPVLPQGSRRELVTRRGPRKGETYSSDWMNYNIARMDRDDIEGLIRFYMHQGQAMQLIYRAPVDSKDSGRVVKSADGKPLYKRCGSDIETFQFTSPARFLADILDRNGVKPLYLAVLDVTGDYEGDE